MLDLGNSEKPLGLSPTGIKPGGTQPQNTEQGIMNVEVLKNEKHFLLRHSLFDIRYSKKQSTFLNT
jgi:hypothetical protein